MKTVLIVDSDLGFVFWLGKALDAHSYTALPAKSVPDAALLIMQLNLTVDVLVIDVALPGAPDFITALHRSQKDVRVISTQDGDAKPFNIPGIHAVQLKPSAFGASARDEWVNRVDSVLAQHIVP